jgi:TonB-dependent receptor
VFARNHVRPTFEALRALQEIDVEQETIDGQVRTIGRTLQGGNPRLRPLVADGVDLSLGVYAIPDTVATAVFFYKALKNPFVSSSFTGEDVALTGQPVFNPATGEGFTAVDSVGNAGSGELFGIELGLNHLFRWLPRPLDGLFVSGNIAIMDGHIRSEQIRDNRRLDLPSQPKTVANISVGYENELLSLRWSGNHVGGSLRTVDAGNPELDTLRQGFWSMDVNARVNVTDWLQLYADATNINRAKEVRYWRGDRNGPLYERADDFGRTFQVGATIRFTY